MFAKFCKRGSPRSEFNFAKSLDPDLDQQNISSDLDLNCFDSLIVFRTRLYEAQLSFNHGLKPRLISALLNRVVRSSIIF